MKFISLIVCMLCAIAHTMGQTLDFDHSEYDFGTIEEAKGTVNHTFRFRNGGDKPLVIYNTRSTCGCTTTEYSEQPIMAGDSSAMVVSYDPTNRPGSFMRDVYIYSTASKEPTVIRITGSVDSKVLTLEQRYPYVLDDRLRISATHLSTGTIKRGMLSSVKCEVINVSADTLTVELRPRSAKEYLDVGFAQQLAPREGATFETGYMIEAWHEIHKGEDGRVADTLDVVVDGVSIDRWLRMSGIVTR